MSSLSDSPLSGRTAERERRGFALFCLLWMFNVFLHVPSFYRTQFSGDENVNLALAEAMNWDLSHLTTMDSPQIRSWPNEIYRKPLFLHGPLFPYVLKIGQLFDAPEKIGFLFANVCMGLLFLHLRWLMLMLRISAEFQFYGYLGAATGALMLFSTTRLHHDALSGILIACSLIAYMDACRRKSAGAALWAGIMASCAMNLRYNGLLIIPLLTGVQLYFLCVVRDEDEQKETGTLFRPDWKNRLRRIENWKFFFITLLLVGTIGMQHFYRLLLEYGTLNGKALLVKDASDPWYQMLLSRTRGQMTLSVLLIVPVLLLFLTPLPYRQVISGMKRGSWEPCLLISLLFLLVIVDVMAYRELRHFAFVTPLLYCCLPFLLQHAQDSCRSLPRFLFQLTIFSSLVTGYAYTIVKPNQVIWIIPAVYEYLPFLMPLYGPADMAS